MVQCAKGKKWDNNVGINGRICIVGWELLSARKPLEKERKQEASVSHRHAKKEADTQSKITTPSQRDAGKEDEIEAPVSNG